MAWNSGGGTLKKTGMSAMMDIYKKKTQANAAQNNYSGSFNPNSNPIYNMYKTANENAGDKIARRTSNSTLASLSAMSGGMPNSYSVGAATQAGAGAAQPFYQRTVDILPELEQSHYNRGIDKLNRQDNINTQLGYANPYGGQPVNPETQQYFGNLQAEINRRKATPDTADDALNPDLEAARVNKIFGDVGLLQKYGSPYRTQEAQSIDLQNQYQGMQNKYYPQIQESTLQSQNLQNQWYPKVQQSAIDQNNASINNIYADNARQNQASSKYERIGPLYGQMMQSGDPSSWLAKNASIMTGDELDALLNYAPKQGKMDYKTNPNFSDELKNISKNKDDFYKMLSNDPQSFINEYGWEGYQELYQRSKPTTSGIQYGLYNIATP